MSALLAVSNRRFCSRRCRSLPKTPEEARNLFLAARSEYEAVFANNNQKLLWASPWPPSGIWAKKPVGDLDALAGLKIRTYDANGTITLLEANAAPIQLSWADVVPQLSTGGIEAVLTSAEAGANAKFWEHLDHFTEVNYAMPLNMIHINLDTWNDLSPEHQDAVLEAAKAAEDHVWQSVVTRVSENYTQMRSENMTVVSDVDPAFLAALHEAGQKKHARNGSQRPAMRARLSLMPTRQSEAWRPVLLLIDRVATALNRIAGGLAAIILVYIFLHIIMEIVLRSFFSSSTFVLDEFVGYAVAAMTFLSLGYALNSGSLIRVDLVVGRLSGRPRRWTELFCLASSIGIAGYCAWWVGRDALRNWTRGSVSESIAEVPLWLPVGAVWLGLILLMVQLLACFLRVAMGGEPIQSNGAE
ncbi:TRAP transporter substrate-binding protein DctP [Roseibium salinum]|nr:TRAP transporter substrate-binding protein DctP [Roseibium salinum]